MTHEYKLQSKRRYNVQISTTKIKCLIPYNKIHIYIYIFKYKVFIYYLTNKLIIFK